mmetsp:Transcript_28674/g.64926  ORF Transcript_28674/g.64926 Transcript_28674/m.64926 type:complete len:323 (+) Transcript_28674:406-1374(+)
MIVAFGSPHAFILVPHLYGALSILSKQSRSPTALQMLRTTDHPPLRREVASRHHISTVDARLTRECREFSKGLIPHTVGWCGGTVGSDTYRPLGPHLASCNIPCPPVLYPRQLMSQAHRQQRSAPPAPLPPRLASLTPHFPPLHFFFCFFLPAAPELPLSSLAALLSLPPIPPSPLPPSPPASCSIKLMVSKASRSMGTPVCCRNDLHPLSRPLGTCTPTMRWPLESRTRVTRRKPRPYPSTSFSIAVQRGRMQPATIASGSDERPPQVQPTALQGCLCRQPLSVCSKMARHWVSASLSARAERGPDPLKLCLRYFSSMMAR